MICTWIIKRFFKIIRGTWLFWYVYLSTWEKAEWYSGDQWRRQPDEKTKIHQNITYPAAGQQEAVCWQYSNHSHTSLINCWGYVKYADWPYGEIASESVSPGLSSLRRQLCRALPLAVQVSVVEAGRFFLRKCVRSQPVTEVFRKW